jgi:hypothetical protein
VIVWPCGPLALQTISPSATLTPSLHAAVQARPNGQAPWGAARSTGKRAHPEVAGMGSTALVDIRALHCGGCGGTIDQDEQTGEFLHADGSELCGGLVETGEQRTP